MVVNGLWFQLNNLFMEMYASILLYVIPGFFILMTIEIIYDRVYKKNSYNLMDTLSSLSSGITNILKDSLGIIFIIISYPYLLDLLSVINVESNVYIYILSFIFIDFASYWGHRLNHKVNLFWNNHIIHHSSEEFNLACALRQSISGLIGFRAIFLIPAAIFGIPSEIIITLTPIHLFAQFWYHTQHIGKLGWIEYILVTPSQHRVHHAINKKYIDKNLSAIFCIWDRIFGTFQEELDEEPPIYGVLKPVRTWNPILINFQHLFYLIRDFYYTKKFIDKIIIWFMPTGWRPKDMIKKYPIYMINEPKTIKKYNFNYNKLIKRIALFNFLSINVILFYFLYEFSNLNNMNRLIIGLIIFVSIFGFTSLMDGYKWSKNFEIFRSIFITIILIFDFNSFFDYHNIFSTFIILYSILNILLISLNKSYLPKRKN